AAPMMPLRGISIRFNNALDIAATTDGQISEALLENDSSRFSIACTTAKIEYPATTQMKTAAAPFRYSSASRILAAAGPQSQARMTATAPHAATAAHQL